MNEWSWSCIFDTWDDIDEWYFDHENNVPNNAPEKRTIVVSEDRGGRFSCDFSDRGSWAYGSGVTVVEAIYAAIGHCYKGMRDYDRRVEQGAKKEDEKEQRLKEGEYMAWLDEKWSKG